MFSKNGLLCLLIPLLFSVPFSRAQYQWRGLYLYKAGNYMGKYLNGPECKKLLSTCREQKINYLILVGLTGEYPSLFDVYSSPGRVHPKRASLIGDFIELAAQYGIKEVAIACSGQKLETGNSDQVLQEYWKLLHLYQAVHMYNEVQSPQRRIAAISSELEWWNLSDGESETYDKIEKSVSPDAAELYKNGVIIEKYQHWIDALREIQSYKKDQNPEHLPKIELYLGYLTKDALPDQEQCNTMASLADRVLLHVYTDNAQSMFRFNYLSRTQAFLNAPNRIEIWPLFSAQAQSLGSGNDFQGSMILKDPQLGSIQALENYYQEELNQKIKIYSDQKKQLNGCVWYNYNYLSKLLSEQKK